jgi:NAD(P)H-dependent flavin oxidoreductase YrpB (nitropropane dioxygenase family)
MEYRLTPSPLSGIGLGIPLLAAPMAGGPSTPSLVISVAEAGGTGFLAAGYKTPEAIADEIASVRSAGVPFGVNVFVPNPIAVDSEEFRRYAHLIQPDASVYGLDLTGSDPVEDDDKWADKIGLLVDDPVPLVSFTFAVPDIHVVEALQKVGTVVMQTVTSPTEALRALAAGPDMLAVQASAAGAHSGTFTPQRIPPLIPIVDLVRAVRQVVDLPVVAAGGLSTSSDVAGVLRAGATGAMVGTALLRTDESGASQVYKDTLGDPRRGETVVTRAFTGRPARAIRNRFVELYDRSAPSGYPAIHHLTSSLRRAAASAGDPERINLWAGTGYRLAAAEPAASVLARLTSTL